MTETKPHGRRQAADLDWVQGVDIHSVSTQQ